MALSKEVTYDYEIRSEYKHIQQRQKTAIIEDGTELSSAYHRRVYSIGESLEGIDDETTVKSLSSSLSSSSLLNDKELPPI